jgi:hypothetical protein
MAAVMLSISLRHSSRIAARPQHGEVEISSYRMARSSALSFGILAGELGFEPRLTESESAVLPLNYSPIPSCNQHISRDVKSAWQHLLGAEALTPAAARPRDDLGHLG